MRAFIFSLALLGLAVSSSSVAGNSYDKASSAVADSWLGHDASELLIQWPVDRGFTSYEVPGTGETAYSYNFGRDAYSYESSSTAPVGQTGNVLIMQTTTTQHDVEARHYCTMTFYANAEGVISRYEYDGERCRPYVAGWGRPKSR